MLDFMVLAAPRSATTWAANWLTTENSLCLHDPFWRYHYTELDALTSTRRMGIACTGSALFPHWVRAHPARKVILQRDLSEVNASLRALGLPEADPRFPHVLASIDGLHVSWRDVFEKPAPIYEYLLERPFDPERHAILREIVMQPN